MSDVKKPLSPEERFEKLLQLSENQSKTIESQNNTIQEQNKRITALEEQVKKGGGAERPRGPVAVSDRATPIESTDIPEEDLLEKPVWFYAHRLSYIENGYNHQGRDIMPPYGKVIKFKTMPVMVSRDAAGKRIETQWCALEVWSKKMADYLKNHPLFNDVWYESLDGLHRVDLHTSNMRMKATMDVSRLNINQVREMCKGRNLKVSNDEKQMRADLADSFAEEALKRQALINTDIVKRNEKEAEKIS